MNCIGPSTPEDFELLAYADGEASPLVSAHLSSCPSCQNRSRELYREQAAWQKALRRAGCPTPLELAERRFGLLPAERSIFVDEHLRYCRACAAEAALLAEYFARTSDPRLEAALSAAGSRLQTLIARLATGGWGTGLGLATPAPRALREAHGPYGEDKPAPVTYEAENILIALEFWPESGGSTRQLVGLVAGASDFAGAEVELYNGGDAPQTAPVDALGSFVVPGVSTGMHRLLVRLPAAKAQVLVEELSVN